jgi:hypothetical protein
MEMQANQQVDFNLLTRLDEEAQVEFGGIVGSYILDNTTRAEFDEVVETSTFLAANPAAKAQRCKTVLPANSTVCDCRCVFIHTIHAGKWHIHTNAFQCKPETRHLGNHNK